MSTLSFRIATEPRDLEQIHVLNHKIFAEEIGQRARHPSGVLIDSLDAQNTYFVAARGDVVIGMVSVSAGPEFSIAKRLADKTIFDAFPRPLEVRLLAIEPQERGRTALAGLFWQVYEFAKSRGHSHLLASAVDSKEGMYRKLGFTALGPAATEGRARFIPMAMPVGDRVEKDAGRVRMYEQRWDRSASAATADPIYLMPGPVAIHPSVKRAYCAAPISHRSEVFVEAYEETRLKLTKLVPACDVALFPGGGTLANDVVAANLQAMFRQAKGLVISNGEFGERLLVHAGRAGLKFEHLSYPWCDAWSLAEIATALERKPAWVWAVHLETSTGVLNDATTLLRLAARAECPVALDCVSSIGAVATPSEMGPLYMASGVSGKSLGSYAGLAFVFVSEACRRMLGGKQLSPSFDLLQMLETEGPVSTIPSPVLFALGRALGQRSGLPGVFRDGCALGGYVRQQLRQAGIAPLAAEEHAAPNITSFVLPSPDFPERCLRAGYKIAYESRYLKERAWAQIATMGDVNAAVLEPLFRELQI